MIDLIIVFVCCYQLHRQAFDKGIPAWPYILQYIAGFVAILFVAAVVMINIWGKDFMSNPEAQAKAVWIEPFAILMEIALYLYLRRRIERVEEVYEDDEDTPPTTPPGDKKDLSYFR